MRAPELAEMVNSLATELVQALNYDQIGSGAGYTQATTFELIGFVLKSFACTSWGTSFVAGQEESGRLELVLAHRVGRGQYVGEASAALVVKSLLLGIAAYLLITLLNGPSWLGLDLGHLAAVTLAWVSLGVTSGIAGVAAGAGVAVGGLLFDAVGGMNPEYEWLTTLSPYHWAFGNVPLSEGADFGGLALLWGFFAAGFFGLKQRDLSS